MRYICCLRKENTNFLLIADPDRLTKLLYLSCIFEKINDLNLSLQSESL